MLSKKLFCYILLFLVTAFSTVAKGDVLICQTNKSTPEEERLLDKLFKLVEVKRLDKELKKYKANASLIVWTSPTVENPYYEVSAGYNGPDRYETRYMFKIKNVYVNKVSIERFLKVLDGASGDFISLAKFRKKHRN